MWNFTNIFFKSFSVEASTRGRILLENSIEEVLIVASHNSLLIFSYAKQILELKKEIELFANIKFIKRLPSSNPAKSDSFFLLADDLNCSFCSLDNGEITSKYHSEIIYPSSSPLEIDSIKVITDIDQYFYVKDYSFLGLKYLIVQAYKDIFTIFVLKYQPDGDFKVDSNFFLRPNNDNIKSIVALDPKFYKTQKGALGMLYEEQEKVKFQVVELNLSQKEFSKKPLYEITHLKELNVYEVIEMQDGNIAIFVESNIYLYSVSNPKAPIASTLIRGKITVIERVPNTVDMFLLGDTGEGALYLFQKGAGSSGVFGLFGKSQSTISTKFLGQLTLPHSITMLSNSRALWGSLVSDSYVINITDSLIKDQKTMPFVKIDETFHNLGAISDLKLRKKAKESISTDFSVLTTSYEKQSGQINLLKSGFNLSLEAKLTISYLQNLYSVNLQNSEYIFVFLTTPFSTTGLKLGKSNSQVQHFAIEGFIHDKTSILINAVSKNGLVQVTKSGVSYFESNSMATDSFKLVGTNELSGGEIVLAAVFKDQLYTVNSKDYLQVFSLRSEGIKPVGSTHLQFRAKAFNINDDHIVFGAWNDDQLIFYDRNTRTLVGKLPLKCRGISSIVFSTLGSKDKNFVFCGSIEGILQVIHYTFIKDTKDHRLEIQEDWIFYMGTMPIQLKEVTYQNKISVFVTGNTPSLISLNNKGIVTSVNIHGHEIKSIAVERINNNEYFLFGTPNNFCLGICDADDKVQVKPLPIDCQNEILFSLTIEDMNLLIVGINSPEGSAISIYDINSYILISTVEFKNKEIFALKTYSVNDFRGLIVGLNHLELREGQVLNFEILPTGLNKIQELDYDREVHYISLFKENYIIVALSSFIRIFKIVKEEGIEGNYQKRDIYLIQEVLAKSSFTMPFNIDTCNNYLLVVDWIKGLFLYLYNEDDNKLVPIGRSTSDASSNQMGLILDENTMLVSREEVLQILKRNKLGENESEQLLLQPKASINIRESVFSMDKGSKSLILPLKMVSNVKNSNIDYVVFGTVKGSVGAVASLPHSLYNLLEDLQSAILQEIPRGFGSNYTLWRSYKDRKNNSLLEAKGFVDGEVLKKILTYPQSRLEKIFGLMSSIDKPSPNEIFYIVESLTQRLLNQLSCQRHSIFCN